MGRFCTEVHLAYVVTVRPACSKVVDVAVIDVKGVVAEAALQVLIAFSGAAFGTSHILSLPASPIRLSVPSRLTMLSWPPLPKRSRRCRWFPLECQGRWC